MTVDRIEVDDHDHDDGGGGMDEMMESKANIKNNNGTM